MRKIARSFAMIPRTMGDRSMWYSIWSPECGGCGAYSFVASQRDDGESFRDALEREVSHRLELPPQDYLVANMAQVNLEFFAVLPGEDAADLILASFYLVHLYTQQAREIVDAHNHGRWLTSNELLAGSTEDGHAVDPTLTFLLQKADVIQPW